MWLQWPSFLAQYHHTTCYIQKIRHSVQGCGGRINTTSVVCTFLHRFALHKMLFN